MSRRWCSPTRRAPISTRSGRDDRLALDPIDRVGFSCESLKVTTRLMHVIAWLLTQRAVAAGELSRDQAGEAERRLGAAPETDGDLFPRLPEAAAELVRASEELYGRVSRLDAGSFARGAGGQPGAQPAQPAAALASDPPVLHSRSDQCTAGRVGMTAEG